MFSSKPQIYYCPETKEYCVRKKALFGKWEYLDISPIYYTDKYNLRVVKTLTDYEYGYDSYAEIRWWNSEYANKYCFTKDPNNPIMLYKLQQVTKTYVKV